MLRKLDGLEATSQKKEGSNESIFTELGMQLESLVEVMDDGKARSVHQTIRDVIAKAQYLYDRIGIELKGEETENVGLKFLANITIFEVEYRFQEKGVKEASSIISSINFSSYLYAASIFVKTLIITEKRRTLSSVYRLRA